MIDKNSKYPEPISARTFRQEEEQEFLRLFNSQQFRPRTAILAVLYEYPNDLFFQPIPAKDKINLSILDKDEYGNINEIKKNDTVIHFRNGIISSIDIQEIVKAGGRNI